ncbi:unnamed protein product [Trichogramma brassicae]|uniref:Peptidase S1 domain-containing protein n=1 Tax=Trichogramma brassicae TaxID=86971 RepID=A0A6H5IRD3_9HYME|nr:unnamed protein product [Trichogramma brassicae]
MKSTRAQLNYCNLIYRSYQLVLNWCKDNQFVCGNSKYCIDRIQVCDGASDCPNGEDEKKCAALIDEEILQPNLEQTYRHAFGDDLEDLLSDQPSLADRMISDEDNADVENDDDDDSSSSLDAIVEDSLLRTDDNLTDVVSGREIHKSKNRNNLLHPPLSTAKTNSNQAAYSYAKYNYRPEVNNYNDRGFLSIRKNGKWGKLCLSDELLQRRSLPWSIEDLGRAVCKTITYQDFAKVEQVQEDRFSRDKNYYSLSLSNDRPLEKNSLTFTPTECPNRQVLRVKCKNFECGIRTQATTQARVVGGGSSSTGSWPWQVALYKEGEYQCGGSIISDRWIISAAHCFYKSENEYWVARIGTTKRESLPSPYEQVLRVDYVVTHPNYNNTGYINDIVLLRLEKPMTFSDYVRPVCLPSREPQHDELCTVTGWGQLYEIGRIFPICSTKCCLSQESRPTVSAAAKPTGRASTRRCTTTSAGFSRSLRGRIRPRRRRTAAGIAARWAGACRGRASATASTSARTAATSATAAARPAAIPTDYFDNTRVLRGNGFVADGKL